MAGVGLGLSRCERAGDGLFLAVERRKARDGSEPLVSLAALARRFAWLATLLAMTGTYYALLFTLAQYLQDGLGRSVLFSGSFWCPGSRLSASPVRSRAADRLVPWAPAAGCLLVAAVYAALAVGLVLGGFGDIGLAMLLAVGGFGLGIQFNALIARVTNSVAKQYAPDISGVTTTLQIGGALGIALFGTLYFAMGLQGNARSSHAFAVTALAMALTAFVAAIAGYGSARQRNRGSS